MKTKEELEQELKELHETEELMNLEDTVKKKRMELKTKKARSIFSKIKKGLQKVGEASKRLDKNLKDKGFGK